MRVIEIQNHTRPLSFPFYVQHCSSFFSRLRGLMFRRSIDPCAGVLLDEKSESRANTAIHMLFMNFDITAVWIDQQCQVVDVRLARRWRLFYAPASPARYVLETHPDRLADFHVGDRLAFIHGA